MSSAAASPRGDNNSYDSDDFPWDKLKKSGDPDVIIIAMLLPNSCMKIEERRGSKGLVLKTFLGIQFKIFLTYSDNKIDLTGSDLVDWVFEYVRGFGLRRDASYFAKKLAEKGYIVSMEDRKRKDTFQEEDRYSFDMDRLDHGADRTKPGVKRQP